MMVLLPDLVHFTLILKMRALCVVETISLSMAATAVPVEIKQFLQLKDAALDVLL